MLEYMKAYPNSLMASVEIKIIFLPFSLRARWWNYMQISADKSAGGWSPPIIPCITVLFMPDMINFGAGGESAHPKLVVDVAADD